MEYLLHKLLPVVVLPSGLLVLLLLAAVWRRQRRWAVLAGLLFLLASNPWLSDRLSALTEAGAEHAAPASLPRADAIVVLSGGRLQAPGEARVSEWTDSDRFWGGIELYQAGRAPVLVFTGGASPWTPDAKPEGEILKAYALRLGIPERAIRVSAPVFTTAEEAESVAKLLRPRATSLVKEPAETGGVPSVRIILVTSAYHMPRAQRLFERAHFAVTPYPVDFQLDAGKQINLMDFMPSAGAFSRTETNWRELIGRLYYRMRD